MSDDPKDANSDEGEGGAVHGSSSTPHDNDKPSGSGDPSPDEADQHSGESEVGIGIPMTPEEWRKAKKQAERADSED